MIVYAPSTHGWDEEAIEDDLCDWNHICIASHPVNSIAAMCALYPDDDNNDAYEGYPIRIERVS